MKKIVWLGGFVFLTGMGVCGQETTLDSVTLVASYSKQKVSETGRDIIVIKGESFEKLPVHSLDELLRYVPGIEVQQRGPMGSQSDILIRGGTFQQVLVILDGMRLNDPLTGHFNSYIPIAPGEIESVEILKGASSAIYGAEAVGGVINIITKSFAGKRDTRSESFGGAVAAGQYGLINADASGVIQRKNSILSAGILTDNADGVPQRGIRGYFHNTTISGSVKQFISDHWSIALRSAYDTRDFAAQNFYTAFVSDTATEKVTTWWNQLQLAYEKGKQRFSFDAGYKEARDNYDFSKAATPNQNHSKLLQALALYTNRVAVGSVLTTGIQYAQASIVSNDRGNHTVNNAGVFAILNQTLFNSLHLSPAIRTDWNELSGWQLIPQFNGSWSLTALTIRGSVGKTLRNADFTERYNNYNKSLVTSGNIGNPSLAAERSLSWEIGVDYYLLKSLKISAGYFNKDYSQLIDWVNTAYTDMPRKNNLDPVGNYYLARNISSIRTQGFETDLLYKGSFGDGHALNFSTGLLWLHSGDHGKTPSLYISSHADFLWNYTLVYQYKKMELGVNGLYKKRPAQAGNASLAALSPDYYVMNCRLSFNLLKNKLSLFAEADNIFNRQYVDRFGVPMPRSWWMGGLRFFIQ